MSITASSATPPGVSPSRNLDGGATGLLLPSAIGLAVGVPAGITAHQFARAVRPGIHPAVGIGIGVAAALAAGGITALIRNSMERLPSPRSPEVAPTLPDAATVAPLPTGMLARGTRVGETYESDYVCTTDSDGDQDCSWETDYDPIRIIESIGARSGYSSVADAIRATAAGTNIVVRREGDRYRPYVVDPNVNSSPDRAQEMDPSIAAFVTRSEAAFTQRDGDILRYSRESARRTDASGAEPGDTVARLALHRQFDGGITNLGPVTASAGLSRVEDAIGEAAARPGDQGVVSEAGRFHVVSLQPYGDSNSARLDGVLGTRDGASLVALEYRGETLVRSGAYWVAPNAD